jgi:serine 3-dehydrogenase
MRKSIQENKENTVTKTVLITGATSGFGAAMARRFANAGWRVVAMGRRSERLRNLVDEFGPETITAAAFDVRNVAAMDQTLSALPESFRTIDVLINQCWMRSKHINRQTVLNRATHG